MNSVPRGTRVLAGVSGGRDSMAMLHGLLATARALRLTIGVCHVDHRLRDGSEADSEFVESFCRERAVPYHAFVLGSRPDGSNLEAWARDQRYAAFRAVMEESCYDWCLTAHTANDVAETLVMRALSNKGAGELASLDLRRRCLRPLILVTRRQIDEYVSGNSVPYRDDPTNADTKLLRNRVRLELLPFLERHFDAGVVWRLAESAERLAEDEQALESEARASADKLGPLRFGDLQWANALARELSELPSAVQWRLVELIFLRFLGIPLGRRRALGLIGLLQRRWGRIRLSKEGYLELGTSGLVWSAEAATNGMFDASSE